MLSLLPIAAENRKAVIEVELNRRSANPPIFYGEN